MNIMQIDTLTSQTTRKLSQYFLSGWVVDAMEKKKKNKTKQKTPKGIPYTQDLGLFLPLTCCINDLGGI